MKRIALLSIATCAIWLTGCKKFLDKDFESNFSQDFIFSNIDDAKKSVNSVYALFNQDAYTSRLSNNFAGNSDVEMGGIGASPDNSRRDIWSFEATPANGDLLTVWNNGYNAINRANDCIEGIKNSALYKANDPAMTQLLGEASALRAYWYYFLMNHWGDVPFKSASTKAGDELYLPKTGRDSILTFLIDDLIAVEPGMSWADQLDFGIERINREFVMGFIARLALMRGGYWLYPDMTNKRMADYKDYYKIASDYCRKLTELKPHTLNPDFRQIFYNQCQGITPKNDDVLWEVAFHPGFGDVAWNNGVRVDGGSHPYGAGSNYLGLPPSYYYSFDSTDKRLPVTCSIIYFNGLLEETLVAVSSIAPGKWNRLWLKTPPGSASAKGTGINWPVMRYSDILLMLAEAENELNGPNASAMDALKMVRRRAFNQAQWPSKVDAYVTQVSASKAAFFEAIVDERAWEFGGECMRKYDLIRWGNYGEKIAETRKILGEMGKSSYTVTGDYVDKADYLYYKRNADGSVTFLNRFNKPAVAPPVKDFPTLGDNPNGYLRASWLRSLYNATTGAPTDYVNFSWRGYKDLTGVAPVRYILPIHSSVITSSLGILDNNGYGF